MQKPFQRLALLLLSFGLISCATTVSTLSIADTDITVGEKYPLPTAAIRFANRGYIDSIVPSQKTMEQLREGADYDGYSQKPKALIPKGTKVTIHKIYKTKSGKTEITALLDGEKVSITNLFFPPKQ